MAAIIAFLFASFASAAPVSTTPSQNSPVLVEPTFVPEPRGRGTLRLLFSCIITLVMCVWTAIHPNIIRNPTLFRRLQNKAFYVVLALFSPEIVLSIALSEWQAASRILRAARLAGAVDYAEAEVKRVEETLNEISADYQLGRDRVVTAVKNARDTASGARLGTATASRAAAAARSSNTASPSLSRDEDFSTETARTAKSSDTASPDHSHRQELSCWAEAQRLQWAAFESARELRLVFREHQTECRPGKRQWMDRRLNALRRLRATKWLFSQDPIEHDLGKECAYFAVMGGYTFCPLNEEHNPDHEFTLTPDALAFLLREECITTVRLAKIRRVVVDKGKSDMIAKLVVCVQGLWMGFNCLSRKIAGLPLTLLELNVVMHVLCAVVVYVCWWKKPHDAGLPISLSRFFLQPQSWALIYTTDKYGPRLCCSFEEPPSVETPISENPTSSGPDEIASLPATQSAARPADRRSELVEQDEKPVLSDEVVPGKKERTHFEPLRGFTLRLHADPIPSERERNICASAAKEMRRLYTERSPLVSVGVGAYPLSTRCVTMSSRSDNLQTGRNLFWVLVPLCLIYGAAHAGAWNRHFPTATERLLWRISCIIVGAPGPGAGAVWFFEFLFSKRANIKEKLKQKCKAAAAQVGMTIFWLLVLAAALAAAGGSIYGIVRLLSLPMTRKRKFIIIALSLETTIVVGALCVAVIAALVALVGSIIEGWRTALLTLAVPVTAIYCAARAFIVIESFISMRSLPLGAYKTVAWENVWPHF